MSEANEVDGVVMRWCSELPTVADLNGKSEEYYWMRGGELNRLVIVRCNNGVISSVDYGVRKFRAEVNFQVFAENWRSCIWRDDFPEGFEFYGPIARPFA